MSCDMPKVQELARELGMTSQELLRHLERIGRPAAGHTSIVDDDVASRLRSEVGNGSPGRAEESQATTTLEPAAISPEGTSTEEVPTPDVVPEWKEAEQPEKEAPTKEPPRRGWT